ncbi:SRPBCC family protein [Actinoplanes subtropicus]|uniref:SRPBCC family protein n=1 Tax=Actinoplanes subtropicus TaxID=543632 RepID=UPI0007C50D29|nr:hypothetical protein [Actinoplanes subtropicus]
MVSRITLLDRPRLFVDEQTRGPFRLLRHEHLFRDLQDAGTQMTDRMTVSAPLGPLGAVVTRLLLAPYLRRLLKQRAAHIERRARRTRIGPDDASPTWDAGSCRSPLRSTEFRFQPVGPVLVRKVGPHQNVAPVTLGDPDGVKESLTVSISNENYGRLNTLGAFRGVSRLFADSFGKQAENRFNLVWREASGNVRPETVADHTSQHAHARQP